MTLQTRPVVPTVDDRPIWDVIASMYEFPCLAAADEMGLFTRLAQQSMTSAELAGVLEIGPRASEAMLGLLTSMGYLAQHGGRFQLTERSRTYLVPESPYYYGPFLQLVRAIPVSWQMIRDAAKNDKPVTASGEGLEYKEGVTGNWEGPAPDMGFLTAFTAGMHAHSFPSAMSFATREVFNGVKRLLDVGGGSGGACIALAQHHPEMRFTLLELPPVCTIAQDYIAKHGLTDRIEAQPGEMFSQPWPAGHDAIFMSDVLHDWEPSKCRAVLKKAFDTLPAGGRIFLHEILLTDTKDGPLAAMAYSFAMLLATKGKQLAFHEVSALLADVGFEDVQVQPGAGYFSLVHARKPSAR